MIENRPKPGPLPVEYPSFLKKRRTVDSAAGVEPAHIATLKTESSEVTIPLIEITTVRGAPSPLSDESPVLEGGDPVQSVTQGVVKTRRSHPAFAFRTAQPKIVAASTPLAKTWRLHPAFASRSQPTSVRSSAVVDLALTIKQPSEVTDLAPPATWLPRSLHLPQPGPGNVATRPPSSINLSAPPKPADELIRERSITHKE